MRTPITTAPLLLVVCLLAACQEGASGASPGGDAKPSPGGTNRKLKTALTAKQVEDTWGGLKGNHDFKKHTELVTAKLGAAHKVTGDQSCWFGYKAAQGPVPEDCMQLCTSATKGSGTMAINGAGACWE